MKKRNKFLVRFEIFEHRVAFIREIWTCLKIAFTKSCMKAELRPNEFQKKLIHLLNLLKMPKCELKMLFFANLSFLSCILVIFIF